MQLNYDFVIFVVTYHHPIINVSKKEMKSVVYVYSSSQFPNEESLLLHFSSLFVFAHSLFPGFISNSIKLI